MALSMIARKGAQLFAKKVLKNKTVRKTLSKYKKHKKKIGVASLVGADHAEAGALIKRKAPEDKRLLKASKNRTKSSSEGYSKEQYAKYLKYVDKVKKDSGIKQTNKIWTDPKTGKKYRMTEGDKIWQGKTRLARYKRRKLQKKDEEISKRNAPIIKAEEKHRKKMHKFYTGPESADMPGFKEERKKYIKNVGRYARHKKFIKELVKEKKKKRTKKVHPKRPRGQFFLYTK